MGSNDSSQPSVSLWLNLARSGGTILARCLGCMDEVVLLSEVHPLGRPMIDPVPQALRWHGLVRANEQDKLQLMPYAPLIRLMAQRAHAQGKRLVLRDWSHLDFLGVPFVEPSMSSRTMRVLQASGSEIGPLHCFATVRHPMDMWVSQQRLDMLQGQVDIARFLQGVRAFAKLATEVGFVRYEDFTQHPDETLKALCKGLGVAFDPHWIERYRLYDKVTGDVATRRKKVGAIVPARKRAVDEATATLFDEHEDYHAICEMLGYQA